MYIVSLSDILNTEVHPRGALTIQPGYHTRVDYRLNRFRWSTLSCVGDDCHRASDLIIAIGKPRISQCTDERWEFQLSFFPNEVRADVVQWKTDRHDDVVYDERLNLVNARIPKHTSKCLPCNIFR